jgi:uncharacterized Zn finger protein
VKIQPLDPKRWQAIKKKCAGEIGSVVELLQGKLSKHVLGIVTDKKEGLFPAPNEIDLDCSCPDWATMCKHVAATLYGVGVLLDKSPELFFKLRGVDHLELIDSSVSIATGKKDSGTLDDGSLEDIFGVELADSLEPKKKTAKKTKAAKKTTTTKTTASRAVHTPKTREKVASKPTKKAVKKSATVKKATKNTKEKVAKQKAVRAKRQQKAAAKKPSVTKKVSKTKKKTTAARKSVKKGERKK